MEFLIGLGLFILGVNTMIELLLENKERMEKKNEKK